MNLINENHCTDQYNISFHGIINKIFLRDSHKKLWFQLEVQRFCLTKLYWISNFYNKTFVLHSEIMQNIIMILMYDKINILFVIKKLDIADAIFDIFYE